MITHLLFDLDYTLYSSHYEIENNVSNRVDDFVMKFLSISKPEVEKIRQGIAKDHKHGTTLEWLMAEKGFNDKDAYYNAIYSENDADCLSLDPDLENLLAAIPLPKYVLTNSRIEHAERVLGKLGIKGHFNHIFDISFNNYIGKPKEQAYLQPLKFMDAKPETTLFIDDIPKYVNGFLTLGGKALLYDEQDIHKDYPHPRIRNLHEVNNYLK